MCVRARCSMVGAGRLSGGAVDRTKLHKENTV